ncbi:MAG: HDOD domain-containing protein [Pseudomonadota bacterium]
MQKIGKFDVIQTLGRGGQSTVLLAQDPDLDRRVAIKLLSLQGEPASQRQQFLREARAISAVRHPAVVTVFEAGEHLGTPYLVFEYVEGETLAQRLCRGALPAEQAAKLLLGALDGLAVAHEASIVHRDFKPSNILVNTEGVARVMDFGVASRVGDGHKAGGALSGTPCYMAPEYISRGEIGPLNDLFAAGLILFEMLFGRRPIEGDSVFQTLHRIANEPIVLPADAAAVAGEQLLDVIAKSTAKDPLLRYGTVREMQSALRQYLSPATQAMAGKGSGSSTLDFLLLRISHKTDFPAMSASIATINQLASSERSNAATLASAILKDLALTNKILRIANSAYYNRNGGGRISTVSRAIVILGFETVRHLAISLMLFEHIQDKQQAHLLKDEFLRANLRALLARSLSIGFAPRLEEQAFICGLFHGLGRLLVQYYFQDEAAMLRRLVVSESCSEDAAAFRVLGISLSDLGMGIARSWGFPEMLIQSMKSLGAGRVPAPNQEEDGLHQVAVCAEELGRILECSLPEKRASAIAALLDRYRGLSLSSALIQQATIEATEGLRELVQVLHIPPKSALLAALLPQQARQPTQSASTSTLPGLILEEPEQAESDAGTAVNAEISLGIGIQDISQALVDELMKPADILAAIAEVIYRALAAHRVVICLREGSTHMRGRYGVGEDIQTAITQLRFALGGRDLFNLVLAKDVDVLVSDTAEEKIRQHLPDWYRQRFAAQSFIALPLKVQGQAIGMIYADSLQVKGLNPSPAALTQLRTLRNQALMAIRLGR